MSELHAKSGFSIIEAVVVVGVFAVVMLSFAKTMAVSGALISESRSRMIAVSVAEQQMEQLRNLPYDEVAIVGGVPAGNIPATRTVTVRGIDFAVAIDARYVDDADDGIIPADVVPNDYKRVQVDVTWGEFTTLQRVVLISRFISSEMETNAGGGTLAINVFDAEGAPVSNAIMEVTNSTTVPNIAINAFTDTSGQVMIPGAPAADNYALAVTKPGYESVTTYPPYPATAFTPIDQHATVIEGILTTQSLIMGKLSSINLTISDPFGNELNAQTFDMVGGRQLGVDTGNNPVYNFNQSVVSNSSGEIAQNDLSPGIYTLTLDTIDKKLLYINDIATVQYNTITLPQGTTKSVSVIVADEALPSITAKITDSTNGNVVSGATVQLINSALSYDESMDTNQYGDAYFPISATESLVNAVQYEIIVTATGYQENTQTITINNLTELTIALAPI